MKKILIRADDLGYSRAVNYGIFDSIHNGVINNVGVMVNMPSTQQGLDLLKNEDIDYGMHTNISNGKPVLPTSEVPSLVDENGNFKRSRIYRKAFENNEDFVDLDEVTAEIEAQYNRFTQLIGRKPDYFEGHAVLSKNYIDGLHRVAHKYRLPMLDFAFSDTPVRFKKETKFKSFMVPIGEDVDPFDTFKSMFTEDQGKDVIPMMVCHPGYLDQYILNTSMLTVPRTKEVEMAMSSRIWRYVKNNDIKLVRYSKCK
ncbi:MAG: ChbG/HpnK family deacetylase [Lactobacillus sp.]|nr:ChbG/HpnK family deacetylase [Lactobacillus sp.]